MRTNLLISAALAVTTACATAPTTGPGGTAPADALTPRDYLPAEQGNTWAYDVMTPASDRPGLTILRVVRADRTHATFDNGDGPFTWEFDDFGVRRRSTGDYILKSPIEVGHSWPIGDGGTARIAATEVRVVTPSGTYDRCVVVREDNGEVSMAWWLAPRVGPVVIEAWASRPGRRSLVARAMLRSYVSDPVQVASATTEVEMQVER